MPQTESQKSDKSKATSPTYLETLTSLNEVEKIKEFASLFFTIEEIAILIGVDSDELRREIMHKKDSPRTMAYRAGSLESQVILRHESLLFAKSGSPQAEQTMLAHLRRQMEYENQ